MNSLSLGFACLWYRPDPRPTWSFTPWNLREELRALTDVVDVGPSLPRLAESALKAAHVRLEGGRPVSTWSRSRTTNLLFERDIRRRVRTSQVQAVLQMMDFARIDDRPSFIYQDLSRRLILERFGTNFPAASELNDLRRSDLERGLDHQREVYESSDVVFCMSRWLADDLVADGLRADRVEVVPPGANAQMGQFQARGQGPAARESGASRLIIVGRDLVRKGLNEVLSAVPLVRDVFPGTTLTVIGPEEWPLRSAPPAWVDFRGALPAAQVAEALSGHDLFVMPSRWEGFGIAFVEALLAGVPCVGRADCAMPEIIDPPRFGRVVGEPGVALGPESLAAAIVDCLVDHALYERVASAHDELLERYSWRTAAQTMATKMSAFL